MHPVLEHDMANALAQEENPEKSTFYHVIGIRIK